MLTMLNKSIIVSIDRKGFDCKAKLQMCKLKRLRNVVLFYENMSIGVIRLKTACTKNPHNINNIS
jgi:hypothetical protein